MSLSCTVQVALIGSRPRAFQQAVDKPCMLPLNPQRVAQNVILLLLPEKFNFCRKMSSAKFLYVKTSRPKAKLQLHHSSILSLSIDGLQATSPST